MVTSQFKKIVGRKSTCGILEHVLHLAGVLLVLKFMYWGEIFSCAIVKLQNTLQSL